MSLDLYVGPMFAGKSTAILGIIRRNNLIGRKTFCITSIIDTRYMNGGHITSHNHESYPAYPTAALMSFVKSREYLEAQCVIIEEAQFFPDLKEFVLNAVENDKKHVVCAGLDGDSGRRPFGQVLDLIPFCDSITQLSALCTRCKNGTAAIFTFRVPGAPTAQVNVGGTDQYEPLCRKHYVEHLLPCCAEI